MGKWTVEAPIYGSVSLHVEAENAEQAIARAKEGDWSEPPEIETWEVSEGCRGNVCNRMEHDRFKVVCHD